MAIFGWIVDWPKSFTEELATYDADDVALAEERAVASLRMLTAYRVGGDPITVMPCGGERNHNSHHYLPGSPFHPVLLDSGDYGNCWCGSGCSCGPTAFVRLDGPIGRIDSVMVDGALVHATSYHVEAPNLLVRTDGKRWPVCSGTDFTVTYLNGYPVSRVGRAAAGALAREFLLASVDDQRCQLPSGIRTLSRQGMSMDIEAGLFPEGYTGNNEVDLFIKQWNPTQMTSASAVYSPDVKRNRRVLFGGPLG